MTLRFLRSYWPAILFSLFMCGMLAIVACTAAQKEAMLSDFERVRAIAGNVCLEKDGWRACLEKCEARERERRDKAAGGGGAGGGQ